MANSVNPDQTKYSNSILHCFLRPAFPYTLGNKGSLSSRVFCVVADNLLFIAGLSGSVICRFDCDQDHGFEPIRVRQYSFIEIDGEIFSMVSLVLLLIQEGHLSVSGKRRCTSTSHNENMPIYYTENFTTKK